MTNWSARAARATLPLLLAFSAGLVFGIGLLVSALADPARVLAFLDVAGAWDPSLLLTMVAAIAVGLVAVSIARRRPSTLLGLPLHLPTATAVDRRLVLGGLLFGIGWGMAGICPGPGFVLLGTGSLAGALYLAAMVAGMALVDRIEERAGARRAAMAALPALAPATSRTEP